MKGKSVILHSGWERGPPKRGTCEITISSPSAETKELYFMDNMIIRLMVLVVVVEDSYTI